MTGSRQRHPRTHRCPVAGCGLEYVRPVLCEGRLDPHKATEGRHARTRTELIPATDQDKRTA